MTDEMKELIARWRTAEFNYDFTPADCADELEAAVTVATRARTPVPGVYLDPEGKPVLSDRGDNMTPEIVARRGLRPLYL